MLLACLALAIASTVSIAIAQGAGLDAVGKVLGHVKPAWLGVVGAAQVLALVGYALTYRVVGAMGESLRLPPPLALRLAAAGFGAFTIGGGFALDYRALDRRRPDRRRARVKVLTLGSLEYLVLAPVAAICAAILLSEGSRIHLSLLLPWVVAVPLGFAAAFVATARARRWLRGRGAVRARLDEILASVDFWRHFRSDPVRSLEATAGMAVYWCAEILSLWAALAAFSTSAPLPAIIVAYATGYAATRRTLPLGGAGATEALMTYALHWVGIALAPAFAGVVVYRFFNFVAVTPPALHATARLERELAAPPEPRAHVQTAA